MRTNKMTSSNNKTLTDFSIKSIIGTQTQKHVQETNKSKPSECSSSRQQFTHKNQIKLITTNNSTSSRKYRPKNFQCSVCKMAFSNNGQLKNHVRIHTGERPFKCNHSDCNKTFTRNEELTRHKLIHTGVRPHACTTCGKRFGRKDHLKKHVRTHDRKKYRKKVFVPSVPIPVSTIKPDNDIFTPLKAPVVEHNKIPMTSAFNSDIPNTSCSPITTTSNPFSLTSFPQMTAITTSALCQQFANDYWNKWYGDLIGIYQQRCHQNR